jgi:hypothetical protein
MGDSASATQFSSVVAVDDGFVITGSRGQAGEAPTAFHSPDGLTWTEEALTGRWGGPSSVLRWGSKVFGMGTGETNRCGHPVAIDTWVRAKDGTWTEAPFDPLFCVGGSTNAAVVLGDGLVVVGAGTGDVPFLLESDDGLTWTNHADRLGADTYPRAAIVDRLGIHIFATTPDGASVVLSSADGVAYERHPLTTTSGQPVEVLAAVVVDDEPLILVTRGAAVGALRLDDNGRLLDSPTDGLIASDVASVTVADGHLVAIGGDAGDQPLVWGSADGTTWTRIDVPEGAIAISGIGARNGTAVLIAQFESADGAGAVGSIWTGPEALLAP